MFVRDLASKERRERKESEGSTDREKKVKMVKTVIIDNNKDGGKDSNSSNMRILIALINWIYLQYYRKRVFLWFIDSEGGLCVFWHSYITTSSNGPFPQKTLTFNLI